MTSYEEEAELIAIRLAQSYENAIMNRANAQSLAADIREALLRAYRQGCKDIKLR